MATLHITVVFNGSAEPAIQIEPLDEADEMGALCALMSQEAFGKFWDSPEEDEAWKDL